MPPAPGTTTLPPSFAARWARLARAVELDPAAPVVVALSGGADSVLLLHLAAVARPRPRVVAVHVDHGLRGAESREDAAFCARLCASLGVPFVRRTIELDPHGPSLEARARDARYAVLAEEALRAGVTTIATGHHADDALETLLMRWLRGTHLGGLAGLKASRALEVAGAPSGAGDAPGGSEGLRVVRPLIALRREEVRALLRDAGLAWREDRSNLSARFTRNRVRHALLPTLAAACGPLAIENLRAFGAAVETLEQRLAAGTAHLAWGPPAHAAARHPRGEQGLGGTLPRAALMRLPPPLRRRALWRLLFEGVGAAPTRRLLERVLADLGAGRCGRHALGRGWSLQLRSGDLHLLPPAAALSECSLSAPASRVTQLAFPYATPAEEPASAPPALRLSVPGVVTLPDGRRVGAEWVEPPRGRPAPRSELEVELDAHQLAGRTLAVRFARAGDRFHPLGGPGHRKLARFLADAGVPREDRGRVPLVCAGDELLWVCGLRPCEPRRVGPGTGLRLRLTLHGAAEPELAATPAADEEPTLFPAVRSAG